MEGLDDISLTLRHEAAITAFEVRRHPFIPVVSRP
jgi:3-isopropylmalate/(R)-2-methylmalate dehydratase small subunit